MRKKIFKILVCCTSILILLSLIIIPVSATTGHVYTVPVSQPSVSDYSGYVEIHAQDDSGQSFAYVYIFVLGFSENSYPPNTYPSVIVSHVSSTNSVKFTAASGYTMSMYCVDSSGANLFKGLNKDVINANFTQVHSIRCYGAAFLDSSSVFTGEAFSVVYGSDGPSYVLLSQILAVLSGQSNSDIISNNNQIASQIQQNQDENTDKIIQNQEEQTDKITNGWQSDADVESGETDNVASAEQDLIDGNKEQFDTEVSAVNDSVLGSIQRYASSFGCVGAVFRNLFLKVPDFNVLIYFSLAIGIVPLIVGLSINGLRASDRRQARQRRSK